MRTYCRTHSSILSKITQQCRCNDESSSWHDECFARRPIFLDENQIVANSPPESRAENALPPVKKTRRRKQGPMMYTRIIVEQGLIALNSDSTGDISCRRPVCTEIDIERFLRSIMSDLSISVRKKSELLTRTALDPEIGHVRFIHFCMTSLV
jgi:hypothetical protein